VRSGIARLLTEWYTRAHRDLPWRRTSDPYSIWVSEIMLQQTRAAAVVPYYQRFLAAFPGVEALAAAPEERVLALWSGLGYYSRARNLRRAAQQVVEAGGFPRTFAALRGLPGVGDYTAAAIASIAFGERKAVLDGNVLRVVARIQNDSSDIGAPAIRERFRAVAQRWLGRHNAPAVFNQALMELGATVCLPRNPQCSSCPVEEHCQARVHGTAAQLPVKLRRTEPVYIAEDLLLVRHGGRVLLRRRDAGARLMAGFWDLPRAAELPRACPGKLIGQFRHSITHHRYTFEVHHASLAGSSAPDLAFQWFSPLELSTIPLSTTARKSLKLAALL
jgi:A/G-specific adenine glycosylase